MNKPPIWQMIATAIDALNGKASYREIKDYIHKHWDGVNDETITYQIIAISVNHKSRIHYPENKKPRIAQEKYDVLYWTGRGQVVKYDPAIHGTWEVYLNAQGQLGVRLAIIEDDELSGPATFDKNEWIAILQNEAIVQEKDIALFQTLYGFENHAARSSEVGKIMGYEGKTQGPVNSRIGHLGKRISKFHDINEEERAKLRFKYWNIFFTGWYDENNYFYWCLRDELASAMEVLGLTGEEAFADDLAIPSKEQTYPEGMRRTVTVNAYERNPKARQACIAHHGAACQVCGFDFEKTYGEIGKGYIHVHHIKPISEIGKSYEVDPKTDLVPVCPNCHAMLHKRNPPFGVEELRGMRPLV